MGAVHFFAKHDDRKGHHYYTRWLHRPTQSYIVVMTLAVIMVVAAHRKKVTPTLHLELVCLLWLC